MLGALLVSNAAGCAQHERATVANSAVPRSAAEAAAADPCSVLAALMGSSDGGGLEKGAWVALFDEGCTETGLGHLRPMRAPPRRSTLFLSERELFGNDAMCRNGFRGPPKVPQEEYEYYLIELVPRNPPSLAFQITPGYVEHREGKFIDVIQGCASYEGELRLRP